MTLVEPELRRARGENDLMAWTNALAAIVALGTPHIEAYVRWRRSEALAQSGGSREELEVAIRQGITQAAGLNEPARMALVALAEEHGIDIGDQPLA